MTYVIAQPCVDVKDRACVDECPVDCIYDDPQWDPAPDDWWQEPVTDDPY